MTKNEDVLTWLQQSGENTALRIELRAYQEENNKLHKDLAAITSFTEGIPNLGDDVQFRVQESGPWKRGVLIGYDGTLGAHIRYQTSEIYLGNRLRKMEPLTPEPPANECAENPKPVKPDPVTELTELMAGRVRKLVDDWATELVNALKSE